MVMYQVISDGVCGLPFLSGEPSRRRVELHAAAAEAKLSSDSSRVIKNCLLTSPSSKRTVAAAAMSLHTS